MRFLITSLMLLVVSHYAQAIPADFNEPAASPVDANSPVDDEMIILPLPAKDSTEYWVLRSDAVQEFIPLLTKKRLEMKTRAKMLTNYLIEIGKTAEFASANISGTYDPKLYADILKTGPGLNRVNGQIPDERPTWDQLVEISMQHVLQQGYLPTDVEESEREEFIAACKKKEEYGQKVRADLHAIMDQCARMWVYLDRIGQLDAFKAHEIEVAAGQEAQYDAQRQAAMQQKQIASLQRAEDEKQREYEQRMARREFSSSRRELDYYYRQQRLLYRQSLLDERFVNSPCYCY